MHQCRHLLVPPLFLALLTPPALADSAKPSYPAVPLLSTSTTVLGETIRYPKGDAHVTASIVTLAPGARTILHRHDVPLFAYILEGELTIDYGMHGRRTYKQGQSLMEAMGVPHYGINETDKPVRLIGVYMGADGVPDVTPIK